MAYHVSEQSPCFITVGTHD